MKRGKPILLVEDDEVDALLVKRAFKIRGIKNPLGVASNGLDALEHLRDPEKDMPCLILLDLNMPKMSGIEFLKVAKKNDVIKRIPVVVLTTSQEERDKNECFELGIAGYMLKPIDFQKFTEMIDTIYNYWVLSEMPRNFSQKDLK